MKMFRFLRKRRQRDAKMNWCQDSSVVSVNEQLGSSDVSVNKRLGSSDVAMNEPTPWTPVKTVSLWKRLKNGYRKLKRMGKRRAAEHSTKAKMNWSQDSRDVAVNDSTPSTSAQKVSLWNWLKKKFRRFKTMWKRGTARNSTNSKPQVGKASFQEELPTDENGENSEDENSILYLKVKAYLASQPHLLLYEDMFENTDENVSFGTLNRCLAEKKGCRLSVIQEEDTEELKEWAEIKDNQLKENMGIETAENEEECDEVVNVDKCKILEWDVLANLGKGRFGTILDARKLHAGEMIWDWDVLANLGKGRFGTKLDARKVHTDEKPMSNNRTGFSVVNDPPPSVNKPVASHLTGMICKNPMKRLTMQDILFHTLFNDIPRPQITCHVEAAKAPSKQQPAVVEPMRKKTSQPSILEAPNGRQAAFPLERKQDALAAGAAPSHQQQTAAPTSQGQCSVPAVRRKQTIPRLQRTYQAAPTLLRNQVAPASQEDQTALAPRRQQFIPSLQRTYKAAPTFLRNQVAAASQEDQTARAPQRNQVAPASKEHVVPHSRRQVVGQQRKTKRINH